MLLELINVCDPTALLDRRLHTLEDDLAMLRRELDGEDEDEDEDDVPRGGWSNTSTDGGMVRRGSGILRPVSTPVKFSRKGSQGNIS